MNGEEDETSVTADDVAKLAGVSRWTVGRAFRENASISQKSREKVLGAANLLGYAPDLLAASLASDRTNLVALLIDDFANPHKLVMMERLTGALRENGWDTLLVNTSGETDATAALLHASQRRVDAAVLIGSSFNDKGLATALVARRMRKLVVFARSSSNPKTISICCDDRSAMNVIADYVLGGAYRRPFFLAGPQTTSAHLTRKETFLCRWQAETGDVPDSRSVPAYDPQMAYDCVVEYLSGRAPQDRPDIMVCENDALAFGAVDAIRYHFGLRVPQDIAVTGFDDVPQPASPHYKLTTYRQPIGQMALGLVQVLRGEAQTEQLCAFSGELVARESA